MHHTLCVPGLLVVLDDVLLNPRTYREAACELAFGSVQAGDDVFHGIAPCADPTLPDLLMRSMPAGCLPTLSFFRRSPAGQVEPNYIHSDGMMNADWTAVLYLNVDPPEGDGTSFWRLKESGVDRGPLDKALIEDRERWERWHHVDAKFNRLVIFKADLYHSRGLMENWSDGVDHRLIQVVFGRGEMPK